MHKLQYHHNATYNLLTKFPIEKSDVSNFFNFLTWHKFKLTLGIPLEQMNLIGDVHQLDHATLPENGFWSGNYKLVT